MERRRCKGFWVWTILFGLLTIVSLASTFEAKAAGPVKLEVLDPRGELFAAPVMSINARLSTLAGKKIGIINNGKAGADAFQPFLEKALKAAVPTVEIRGWGIPYNAYPGKQKDFREVAKWSDGVIGLLGD
jgi:hypothetical protein